MPVHIQATTIDFSEVSVYADGDGLQVKFEDGSDVDEFVHADNLMPGDTVRRTMVITSQVNQPYTLNLSAIDMESTPVDFVNIIKLKLHLDGALIYDGRLGGGLTTAGQPKDNAIDLGSIKPRGRHTLAAEFHLPGNELDNDYQKAHARVQWTLTAKLPAPGSSSSSSSASSSQTSSSTPSSSSRTPSSSISWTGPGPSESSRVPGSGPSVAGSSIQPESGASSGQTGGDDKVPIGGLRERGAWSLLSLMMSLTALLIALVVLLAWIAAAMKRRRYKRELEAYEERRKQAPAPNAELEEEQEQEPEHTRRRLVPRLLAVLFGLFPMILFLILDDLSLPMVFINRWTPWIALAFVIHMVFWMVFLIVKKQEQYEEDEEDETGGPSPA